MKKEWMMGVLALCLSGCIHSTEQLSIDPDGSGTLSTELVVPQGTMTLVDQMMGGVMAQMVEAMPQGEEKIEMPESIAAEMFGSKKTIMQKAEQAGLKIEFDNFSSEKRDNALHVNYKLKFDDVFKLGLSGVTMTQFNISRSAAGEWMLSLLDDKNKMQETQKEMEKFQRPEQENLSPEEQAVFDQMQAALKDLRLAFKVSMPLPIKEVKGLFKQQDANAAGLEIVGDLMDPEFYARMEKESQQESGIVWTGDSNVGPGMDKISQSEEAVSVTGEAQPPVEAEVDPPAEQDAAQAQEPEGSKVYLTSGQVIKGQIIEETDDHVIIQVTGVDVKYYKDEIDHIEKGEGGKSGVTTDEPQGAPPVNF